MSVSTASPATVQIRRGHLLGLLVCVAAAAAAIAWALTTYAADDTGRHAVSAPAPIGSSPVGSAESVLFPTRRFSASKWTGAFASLGAGERHYLNSMTVMCSVVMCQPNEQFAA